MMPTTITIATAAVKIIHAFGVRLGVAVPPRPGLVSGPGAAVGG